MKAKPLAASVLLLIIVISIAASQEPYRQPYGNGECIKSFTVGIDSQKLSVPIGLGGFNVYVDNVYKGRTDESGRLEISAYSGQHTIIATKDTVSGSYSGSWTGRVECYYPQGGTTYVPITINQASSQAAGEAAAQLQPPEINIPKPTNINDIILIIVIAVALIIGIIIVLKSIRYFAINAILGLLVLYLANAFAGLNIAYTWLVILVCAIGGVAGAIIVIILHLNGIII